MIPLVFFLRLPFEVSLSPTVLLFRQCANTPVKMALPMIGISCIWEAVPLAVQDW